MARTPNVENSAQKEIVKAEKQFQEFDQQVKDMTLDRMNEAPKENAEPQTKLSQKDLENSKDIYLKPFRTVSCKEKFNDKFRERYEFDKQYVQFIAENKEIIGEDLEIWTRPYAGMPAEFWKVPTNRPIWGPRYLAEQIKRKYYHRLVMKEHVMTQANSVGQMFGAIAADTTIQRLDAHPVSDRKSIFMGAVNF